MLGPLYIHSAAGHDPARAALLPMMHLYISSITPAPFANPDGSHDILVRPINASAANEIAKIPGVTVLPPLKAPIPVGSQRAAVLKHLGLGPSDTTYDAMKKAATLHGSPLFDPDRYF